MSNPTFSEDDVLAEIEQLDLIVERYKIAMALSATGDLCESDARQLFHELTDAHGRTLRFAAMPLCAATQQHLEALAGLFGKLTDQARELC